jgi:hypothetical protein
MRLTLIDDGTVREVGATVDAERVRVAPADLGWEAKPEGLCRGDVCVPTTAHPALLTAGGVDVAGFAALLGRPLALDLAERAACLGGAAADRAQRLASLDAPDFTLPDLDGRPHSLTDHRGRKVLLLAWASW